MARAQYWVSNSRLPLWLPKPDHTTYLQTWHGTPLKKLGIDIEEVHMPATTTEKYKANFVKSSRKWDYLISPNEYSTNIFKRAFDFNKEMIESGYPRNDYLVLNNNDQFVDDLKLKLKIPLDKKVILYAPTWRDNNYYSVGKYKFALQLDLDEMKRSLSDDYVVILRMHYLVAESFDLSSYENFVYDFSSYEDIRDLYLLADLLVTDYSSVFFDYAILKRPILFFAYDIDDYRENLRGFYFNFEETIPGPIVKTTSDLITAINEISDRHFMVGEDFEKFFAKFCALEDGKATKRVIESVFYNKNN